MLTSLATTIATAGHAFVRAPQMRQLLESEGGLAGEAAFAASWDGMPVDQHMADNGRYRRRRHAVYAATPQGAVKRQPHQPHYQSREYNALNGGIERWFEPVPEAVGGSPCMRSILGFCNRLFSQLAGAPQAWRIEVHQFRIEASAAVHGLPTPEGVHRDGVDYVLVLLMRRHNIASGVTMIETPDGKSLGSFTLTEPFDAALVDDHRVYHGVTAVMPVDPAQPAWRDVLVVTFRKTASAA